MCLLAIFHRVVEDASLAVGANREEEYRRGGEPPQIIDDRAVAGLDPQTGGTWLGVNGQGVLVAVTNRRQSSPPASPRSRGLLVRDMLGCSSAAAAVGYALQHLRDTSYAGCNLVCADRERLTIIHHGDWLRVRPMPPGLHLLAAGDVNEPGDPRLAFAREWLRQQSYHHSTDCVTALRELCGRSGNNEPPICLHGSHLGTVSSSLVVLRPQLNKSVYLHAQGSPDNTPYEDYSHLLQNLNADAIRQ